jgi:hypothetical protein
MPYVWYAPFFKDGLFSVGRMMLESDNPVLSELATNPINIETYKGDIVEVGNICIPIGDAVATMAPNRFV